MAACGRRTPGLKNWCGNGQRQIAIFIPDTLTISVLHGLFPWDCILTNVCTFKQGAMQITEGNADEV